MKAAVCKMLVMRKRNHYQQLQETYIYLTNAVFV